MKEPSFCSRKWQLSSGSARTFPTSTSFHPSEKTLFLCCIFNKEMFGMKRMMSFHHTLVFWGRGGRTHRIDISLLRCSVWMGDKGPRDPVVGSLWGQDQGFRKGMCLEVYGGWSMASGWSMWSNCNNPLQGVLVSHSSPKTQCPWRNWLWIPGPPRDICGYSPWHPGHLQKNLYPLNL